ncbi:MAG: hypothetical protein A2086_10500 [Spirochaetes bacterium GWD1_27_9]|nr:MAG: hypothetical protein A2Y34_10875 [Spirochaetes bacterium GWC1_27_15]OHD29496.1 MAG: hypothetical protein A2086_10500 [Spirochaetes bacterium GWD1_27_9]
MYEIRIRYVENPIDKLKELYNAKDITKFSFYDEYFFPQNQNSFWNDGKYTLRLRNQNNTKKMYFTKYEKIQANGITLIKNIYTEKKEVLKNELNVINDFVEALDLQKIATINRISGYVFQINFTKKIDINITLEYIENYGFSSEIEIKNLDEITLDFVEQLNTFCKILNATLLDTCLLVEYLKNKKT